ncbi:MAG: hypothetical protein KDB18_13445 [Salinibacterium sp.]|nr:hypothetical protein [Salinibacterium sp.]
MTTRELNHRKATPLSTPVISLRGQGRRRTMRIPAGHSRARSQRRSPEAVLMLIGFGLIAGLIVLALLR